MRSEIEPQHLLHGGTTRYRSPIQTGCSRSALPRECVLLSEAAIEVVDAQKSALLQKLSRADRDEAGWHPRHMYPQLLYSKGSRWHWQRRSA